ncbi:MAG: glycosyltransferase [Cyclobacteriaceae bacterium]|nr:glycosyltransferase [Cyclobacteriaceae bacterium]MCH8514838.1 glycosyltransferase [Cyclobacteriaceae bacterium]
MEIFIYTVLSAYFIFILQYRNFWSRMKERCFARDEKTSNIGFSIIIAVRNESALILDLLIDLSKQQYHKDLYEIIIIDDYSQDDTVEAVRSFCATVDCDIKLYRLKDYPDYEEGKKAAISLGVRKAKHAYVVSTDADCRLQEKFLASWSSYVSEHSPDYAGGPLSFSQPKRFIETFQLLDLAPLLLVTGASLDRNRALMSNGANMVFKRQAFYDVHGYEGNEDIPSGDDYFLLQKISRMPKSKIGYLKSKEATVTTAYQADWHAVFQQRLRWASKWKDYSFWSEPKIGAFFILLVQLVSLYIVFFLIFGPFHTTFLLFILLRMVYDYRFIKDYLDFIGRRVSILDFVFVFLIYPFYVVFTGILSIFGRYSWKNRNYGRNDRS